MIRQNIMSILIVLLAMYIIISLGLILGFLPSLEEYLRIEFDVTFFQQK